MKEIIEFAAILFSIFLIHIFGMYVAIKHPDNGKILTVSEIILNKWVNYLGSIFVVVLVAINQPDGFASIGINLSDKSFNIAGIFWGYLGIVIISIGFYLFRKLIIHDKTPGQINEQDLKRPDFNETIRFSGKMERFLFLSTMSIGVIAEEFSYRGYLVLLLGARTGSFVPWAIFSIILSVIIHLYQSRNWKSILFHFLMAVFFVGLTVVTQNIFASITAHLINNFSFYHSVWKRADKQGISSNESQSDKRILIAWFIFAFFNILILWSFCMWVTVTFN